MHAFITIEGRQPAKEKSTEPAAAGSHSGQLAQLGWDGELHAPAQ
jgi:hypothetical protein